MPETRHSLAAFPADLFETHLALPNRSAGEPERTGGAAKTREGPVDLLNARQVKRPWPRTGRGDKETLVPTYVKRPYSKLVLNTFIYTKSSIKPGSKFVDSLESF